uniref:Cadherin EGF LAG seven-pass G-type receptor 2 n=1 Tax=Rhinopithecus bieti TaxID=61621 RepID=A0A2K6LHK1_RHIBE
MTRVAPMPLPTHQTVRRKKRRRKRRLPSLESRAGIACWGLEPRDCPCTVPPRMGPQGLGRPPGQETLGPQQRRVVAMGPLRSGCGRMEILTKASLRRSVCPPSARRAASCGSPWSNALRLPGAPPPVRAAGAAPLPAHRPGRASRSS